MDRGETDGTGEPDPALRVVRPARAASKDRPWGAIVVAVVAIAVLGVGAAVASIGGATDPVTEDADVAAEVTVAPTTAPTTTTEPVPDGPVAPLTGVQHWAADEERLARPAVAVKIDNDPKAMPQRGLEAADVVIEVRVEGISRFMAVFHSTTPSEVGPVRSARTSDPDLLAMLSDPLFGWSGGNPATVDAMRDLSWVRNVDPDSVAGVYSRSSERRAPHNLLLDVPELLAALDDERDGGGPAPAPLFEYRPEGAAPVGVEAAGFDVPVGSSLAGFAWSAERGGWLRWTNGQVHADQAGQQLAPANVVVLETEYVASEADRRSPEAVTLGSGSAWVFTDGRLIEATWSREDRHRPWTLTAADGSPVQLSTGSTWVELPARGDAPRLLPGG